MMKGQEHLFPIYIGKFTFKVMKGSRTPQLNFKCVSLLSNVMPQASSGVLVVSAGLGA